ncbi:MAG: hypothetical protein O7H39_17105, partial [Gammaproteobacteria bacterium]|nr:hypothetical protein [Gammaproteobacteria bacterium]
NLALSTGAALLGPLHAVLSFQSMFYLVAGVDVVMLGLITLFSLDRHKSHLRALFQPETHSSTHSA